MDGREAPSVLDSKTSHSRRSSIQDLLCTYADDAALLQSHPHIQTQKQSRARRRTGRTHSPLRSLASFVHTGISGIPLEVRLFLIAASSRHSQPHATMQMTRKTSRGTRMHVFIFISSSTCVRRNLYSVANVICIILYSAPITAN